jgi:hypothetical protein
MVRQPESVRDWQAGIVRGWLVRQRENVKDWESVRDWLYVCQTRD